MGKFDDTLHEGALAELELRSHFVGRRGGGRIEATFKVDLHTDGDRFYARAIDVSRTGILLEIVDQVYEGHDLAVFAATLERYFGGDTRMLLSQLNYDLRGKLVRVMALDGRLRLAFAFYRPLSLPVCALLGLPVGADRDAETE